MAVPKCSFPYAVACYYRQMLLLVSCLAHSSTMKREGDMSLRNVISELHGLTTQKTALFTAISFKRVMIVRSM
jgi:hypothetical protein